MVSTLLRRARGFFGESEAEPAPAVPKKKTSSYHAVTIATGPRACDVARALRGKRFLSREAPAVPLKNCDRSDCTCRYEHHDDRRKGQRRARDLGVSIDGYEGSEKRVKTGRGRRKSET